VPTAPGLILASTSVYRRELLARLRLPFEVRRPQVDEGPLPTEGPPQRAQRLALAKAGAVATLAPAAVVIGADQVASCEEQILDKPGNAAAARLQLRLQSGRAVQFYSAVAVLWRERAYADCFMDRTSVVLRVLSDAEIDAYIAADEPFDCAGSLRSESLGISVCESIATTDPTALVGLPLIRLAASLRACGYRVP
jgi:7-methyl-GTP pyrophosphatase